MKSFASKQIYFQKDSTMNNISKQNTDPLNSEAYAYYLNSNIFASATGKEIHFPTISSSVSNGFSSKCPSTHTRTFTLSALSNPSSNPFPQKIFHFQKSDILSAKPTSTDNFTVGTFDEINFNIKKAGAERSEENIQNNKQAKTINSNVGSVIKLRNKESPHSPKGFQSSINDFHMHEMHQRRNDSTIISKHKKLLNQHGEKKDIDRSIYEFVDTKITMYQLFNEIEETFTNQQNQKKDDYFQISSSQNKHTTSDNLDSIASPTSSPDPESLLSTESSSSLDSHLAENFLKCAPVCEHGTLISYDVDFERDGRVESRIAGFRKEKMRDKWKEEEGRLKRKYEFGSAALPCSEFAVAGEMFKGTSVSNKLSSEFKNMIKSEIKDAKMFKKLFGEWVTKDWEVSDEEKAMWDEAERKMKEKEAIDEGMTYSISKVNKKEKQKNAQEEEENDDDDDEQEDSVMTLEELHSRLRDADELGILLQEKNRIRKQIRKIEQIQERKKRMEEMSELERYQQQRVKELTKLKGKSDMEKVGGGKKELLNQSSLLTPLKSSPSFCYSSAQNVITMESNQASSSTFGNYFLPQTSMRLKKENKQLYKQQVSLNASNTSCSIDMLAKNSEFDRTFQNRSVSFNPTFSMMNKSSSLNLQGKPVIRPAKTMELNDSIKRVVNKYFIKELLQSTQNFQSGEEIPSNILINDNVKDLLPLNKQYIVLDPSEWQAKNEFSFNSHKKEDWKSMQPKQPLLSTLPPITIVPFCSKLKHNNFGRKFKIELLPKR